MADGAPRVVGFFWVPNLRTQWQYSTDPAGLAGYPATKQVWYSYVRLGRLLTRDGLRIEQVSELKKRELDHLAALVLVRPRRMLLDHERTAIRDFVTGGGGVLVVQNWLRERREANGTELLAQDFGIDIVPLGDALVPRDEQRSIGTVAPVADMTNFELDVVSTFADHPVTAGLQRVALHETCAVRSARNGEVIAGDPAKGALAVAKGSRRRFAVLTDTEVLNDLLLGLFDNERLALQLFRWLAYPVPGATAAERLAEALWSWDGPGCIERLKQTAYVGSVRLDWEGLGGTTDQARLLQLCAQYPPRDLLRALCNGPQLAELTKTVLGPAPAAPDDDQRNRLLGALGYRPVRRTFGRMRHREVIATQQDELKCAMSPAERQGVCWNLIYRFQDIMRDLVYGYGQFLSRDPVELLRILGASSRTSEEPQSLGFWQEAACALRGKLTPEIIRDWHARWVPAQLEPTLEQLAGSHLVSLRNQLAHPDGKDVADIVGRFHDELNKGGGRLLEDCIGVIPEIIRARGVSGDDSGAVLEAVTDQGQQLQVMTAESLAPQQTYFHFARTGPPLSVEPVLVPRDER